MRPSQPSESAVLPVNHRLTHRLSRQAARTIALTSSALVAFAANSLLCRVALRSESIDPALFSGIRLASGALLLLIVWRRSASNASVRLAGSWWSAIALFGYSTAFAFAYVGLSASTGALILFPTVQAALLLAGVRSGERPAAGQWIGLAISMAGLVYMVLPGLEAPPLASAALMVLAGLAWSLYTLRARGSGDPVGATAGNFTRAVPMGLAALALYWARVSWSWQGVAWAVISGAITSGLGYVAWYAAVRHLTTTRAAIVQLAVPALAASAGVVMLGEAVTVRLVASGIAIVGGVALAITTRQRGRG